MTWPTRSDYIDRGASIPAWAGGPQNPDLPKPEPYMVEDVESCPECDCPVEDHRWGAEFERYAASLINDYPGMYDWENRMPNLCIDCCACPRDPMEAA